MSLIQKNAFHVARQILGATEYSPVVASVGFKGGAAVESAGHTTRLRNYAKVLVRR